MCPHPSGLIDRMMASQGISGHYINLTFVCEILGPTTVFLIQKQSLYLSGGGAVHLFSDDISQTFFQLSEFFVCLFVCLFVCGQKNKQKQLFGFREIK